MNDHASKQTNTAHTDANKVSQPVGSENEIEAPALETVVRLQGIIGNRAVQRLLSKPENAANGAASKPDGMIQRALHADAKRAFQYAVAQNPAYEAAKDNTDKYVTTKEQEDLSVLRGRTSRFKSSPEPEKRLKDFIRAYLLKEYSSRMTDAERRKPANRGRYLEKAKQTRDKYKALVDLGTTAPETRAFLAAEGFTAGIPASASDLARTPKIDVRATYIGGEILGMRLRAHLFIVLTMANGKQMYFRGGPSGGSNAWTRADYGNYTPDTVDWDPSAPSVTVMEGDAVMDKIDSLIEASRSVNSMAVPYVVSTGRGPNENCNSTAWTLLDRAGITKNKPTGVHSGWGHILGAESGKGGPMPAAEDNSAPGLAYEIIDDNTKIYRDRAFINELQTAKAGTKIELLSDPTKSVAKIRIDGKIGFTESDHVEEFHEKGVEFRIAVDTNVYTADRAETGFRLFSDNVVEVLDPAFASNPTQDGALVKVKYKGWGDKAMIGYVSDWFLEAV